MSKQHPFIYALGLVFLLLVLAGLILSTYDCRISGGILTRTPANQYVCVQPIHATTQ